MSENPPVGDRLHARRRRLFAMAYRMLGSTSDADDVLQEAWLRVQRTSAESVGNIDAWFDDCGRSCVSGSVAVAPIPSRGPGRRPAAGSDHRRRASADSRGRGCAGGLGGPGAAGGSRSARSGRTGRVRAARHFRCAVRPDRGDRGSLVCRCTATCQPRTPMGAVGTGAGCRPAQPTRGRRCVLHRCPSRRFRCADRDARPRCRAAWRPRRREAARVYGAPGTAAQAQLFAMPDAVVRPVLVNGAAGAIVMVLGRITAVMGFIVAHGRIVEIDVLADPRRVPAVCYPPARATRDRSDPVSPNQPTSATLDSRPVRTVRRSP